MGRTLLSAAFDLLCASINAPRPCHSESASAVRNLLSTFPDPLSPQRTPGSYRGTASAVPNEPLTRPTRQSRRNYHDSRAATVEHQKAFRPSPHFPLHQPCGQAWTVRLADSTSFSVLGFSPAFSSSSLVARRCRSEAGQAFNRLKDDDATGGIAGEGCTTDDFQ